jgi:hypothetical protein
VARRWRTSLRPAAGAQAVKPIKRRRRTTRQPASAQAPRRDRRRHSLSFPPERRFSLPGLAGSAGGRGRGGHPLLRRPAAVD